MVGDIWVTYFSNPKMTCTEFSSNNNIYIKWRNLIVTSFFCLTLYNVYLLVNRFICTARWNSSKQFEELTYLLASWIRVLLEKLTGLQLVKKFPAFYGTRRFITALTSARRLSLTWASSMQLIPPHRASRRSILILSFQLRLGLPSALFPSGFPTKALYTTLPFPINATCPAHLILLESITRTMVGEEYWSWSSSRNT
jgi:hypothetical protein